jgi:hypothetical protein
MKTSSCKSKGRKLQQKVRDIIIEIFPQLEQGDVRSTSMGANGEDIQLSPLAKRYFPYSIECKNVEKLNIWTAFEQACSNAVPNTLPLLIFKRNRSKIMVCVELDHFMELVKENHELKKTDK